MFRKRAPAPIRELQHAFKAPNFNKTKTCQVLKQVMDEALWQRGSDNDEIETFEQWVVTPQPSGLGIRGQEDAEFLRDMLIENGDIQTWGEILPIITRPPGNPGRLCDPSRFYRVTTATTGSDRMQLRLMRQHPEFYERLCCGEFGTIRETAVAAGLISSAPPSCLESAVKVFGKLAEEKKLAFLQALIQQLDEPSRTKLMMTLERRGQI